MKIAWIIRPLHINLVGLLVGVLVVSLCYAEPRPQQTQAGAGSSAKPKPDISITIAKAQADGKASIYFVERLAQEGAVEAIPMLEQKFQKAEDTTDKAHIASALVRLGDKNPVYWDFLAQEAKQVVESGAPDFLNYDSQGKALEGPSPAFVAWAMAHNVSLGAAAQQQMYIAPAIIGLMGLTADPRAIPLLRQALSSPNHQVAIFAAQGLAQIQDQESISLIVDACRRAPAEAASEIARALVYFDTPQAQEAVNKYLPDKVATADRAARARGARPLGN